MGRIIVIDGTSNAGKTTLCDNLVKNVENVIIVPGASIFARINKDKYPTIPPIPKDTREEKENQRFFFKLELDRLIEANKFAKTDNNVFMDRGILEILSVAYSFERIKGWDGIYLNAQDLYRKFMLISKKMELSLPDGYICLQATPEEIIRRNKIRELERGQRLSESNWVNNELISKQIEFFNKFNNHERFHIINTNNMTKKSVLKNVCKLLNLKTKERGIGDD